ncbi:MULTISPECIES: hypothetical protein [Bradyrhizobium]|uniref:hypothetical protein n=1 Tax=Bradyrhizobium TaxID=374 RepID=UPI001BAD86E3|nr:hypothetical protein [Bradyrhizobium liaoningense]MBR0989047.1 hypothetical protein [Bradyrhizobium liaoningense]GMP06441.1 hypothetical protein TM239_45270 [Bradyrhizobium sp. TM239]
MVEESEYDTADEDLAAAIVGDIVEMAEVYHLTPKAEATLFGRLATIAGSEVNKPAR